MILKADRINKSDVMQTGDLGLCVSCEICAAACPEDAIIMENAGGQFLPQIDYAKCTNCELCAELCPGIHLDPFGLLKQKTSGAMFDGPWSAIYTAHSRELDIRKNSTSGGLISALLIELIKANEFDAAFVIPFDTFDGKPARLEATNEVQDILNSARSKYIPTSVYNVIQTLEERKELRYILVGTPCQIYGIKEYMKRRQISEERVLFLGLFCSRTLNFNFIRYIEDAYARRNEKLVKFEFRTKDKYGWPGHSKAYFSSGRQLIIDRSVRMRLNPLFNLKRCLFCTDRLNQLADISFGDCFVEGKDDFLGKSSVIIRTPRGNDVFNRYSHLFILEKESIEAIRKSQFLGSKKDNLEYARIFVTKSKLPQDSSIAHIVDRRAKWRLSRLERLTEWGKNYNFVRTRLYLLLARAETKVKEVGKIALLATVLANAVLKDVMSRGIKKNKTRKQSTKGNIILLGFHLFNKGLQSLTLTTVDNIKMRQPDKNIYLLSSRDFHRPNAEKDIYSFNIMPWDRQIKLHLLDSLPFILRKLSQGDYTKQTESNIRQVLEDAEAFVDISGYALSSQWGFIISIDYLLNIMIAKKLSVPFYIFPQSIGPVDYGRLHRMFLYPLMRIYLGYPEKIFIREDAGLKSLRKFTTRNVEKCNDILLTHRSHNLENIYKGKTHFKTIEIEPHAVGVIPNTRVLERANRYEFYAMYSFLIERLTNAGKKVYLVPYANQDLEIIEEIKDCFREQKDVELISDDLNAIELESIVKQFDFLIASRYHAIVHAYRNGVPVIAIGWAVKYSDLLDSFDQGEYCFDIRGKPLYDMIASKLDKLIINGEEERQKIADRIKRLGDLDVFEILSSEKQ